MSGLGSLGDRVDRVVVDPRGETSQGEGVDGHTLGLRGVVVEGEHGHEEGERGEQSEEAGVEEVGRRLEVGLEGQKQVAGSQDHKREQQLEE